MKLFAAPAARTHSSLAVTWEKPEAAGDVEEYVLFLNGREAARVRETDYTFEGLEPDTEYQVRLRARMKEGSRVFLPESNLLTLRTKREPERFCVTDYGAVGDGKTLNTEAVQRAIDACTPGGMVVVPAGVFVTGALFLKSDMTLCVEEGGRLLGSADPADYPLRTYRYEGRESLRHASLINTPDTKGERSHDITILGKGTIDGNGAALLVHELEGGHKRGSVICLRSADNVYFKDITVRQPAFWCVHVVYCAHVSLNQVQIHCKYDENGERYGHIFNGDGFDPDSSRDVFVFRCRIASQDDCIAVKSGRDEEGRAVGIASEDIRITNCRFRSGFGVAMGSEMAGGIRNVLVQDCTFEDSFSIASVKTPRGRGSYVQNICYDSCRLVNRDHEIKPCKWFKGAIYVDYYYSEDEYDVNERRPVTEGTSVISDLCFRNLDLETEEGYAVYIAGLPESPARRIRLENVRARGANGLYAVNADGLFLENVQVKAQEGDDMRLKNVKDFRMS
ncbi:MAG: glycoside hydrolase family 28 protein [Eubacteriales bacterium]|nr:glycoside hydrolase family 28 protein [Eubacteriales bacterium]